MIKIKAFFYVFYESLTSIAYYKEMLKTKTSFTVKYFLTLSLLFSIVMSIMISLVQIPLAQKAVVDISSSARDMFLQDLVITIKDNKWTINKPEPFIVPFPINDTTTDIKDANPKNLFVLYQDGTIEDLDKLDTLILVNAKNVLVRESKGFRAYPLENLPNGTITRTDFDGFMNQMLNFAKNLPYLLVAFIFIGTLFYFAVFQGSNVLFFALGVWLISTILKKKIDYTASARITAHATTLPMVIMVITKLVGYQIPVPFWFEITTFVFAIIVLVKLGNGGEIDSEAASIEAK